MFEQSSLFSISQDTVSVGQFTVQIKTALENNQLFQNAWVKGEISNLSQPASGHIYFTLKDSQAALRCVMWRSQVARLLQMPKEGDAVEVKGSVTVYEKSGQYQLVTTLIRPAGEGKLYQAFLETKQKLENEGLFDSSHKRPIPYLPKTIGIVTSATGAAVRDMLHTIERRYPLARVVLAPATVQGDAAANELIAALQHLNEEVHPDVILIGRGGGSLEDLWCFNDEVLARTIYASEAPVISGVGHETDFTIADFVADLRAPTPTAAAELATPDQQEFLLQLDSASVYFEAMISEKLAGLQADLEDQKRLLNLLSPEKQLILHRENLRTISETQKRMIQQRITSLVQALNHAKESLELLTPQNVLKRGYAIVYKDGNTISGVNEANVDDKIQIQFSDGKLNATVNTIETQKE
jgi:exodeoxyribonuclease VII large subunit